jgi:hypothetical protein
MGMSTGVYGLFEEEPDGDNGQRAEIPWKKWEGNGETGIEIEVAQIPKDIKIIRFYNSW